MFLISNAGDTIQVATLTKEQRHQLLDPPTNSLIALYLEHGSSEHYHVLVTALMLAHEIVATTQRRLAPITLAACDALTAVFNRGNWKATADEKTAIDEGLVVYRSMVETTSARKIKKCLKSVCNVV